VVFQGVLRGRPVRVLGGAFPRTWPVSALELAVLSAAFRHDEALSRPSAVHLFSDQLPFKRLALHWLAEQKRTAEPDPLIARLQRWTREVACRDLEEWAQATAPAGESLGPGQRLGAVYRDDLGRPQTREQLARALAAGYVRPASPPRLPYYDLNP
jgi:hypothetical protein